MGEWVAIRFIAVIWSFGLGCFGWLLLFAWLGYDPLVVVVASTWMVGTLVLWFGWHMASWFDG
jgi:hypothetical protein